ncbi:MAG TPA: trehalose-6-phosphate synthase [Terriglobales bacterium]|jgi:trehalose 6-phosphate synthase
MLIGFNSEKRNAYVMLQVYRMTRLMVVSNRLPVTTERTAKSYSVRISSGGLVSALLPIINKVGGCWVGAAEYDSDSELEALMNSIAAPQKFQMAPVLLPPGVRHDYYNGFCNEILWPLFHDLQSRCNFEPRYWHAYVEANSCFSETIVSRAAAECLIWVQDYHLMPLGGFLAQHVDRRHLLYFHHIPFPPPDVFEKLPWRRQILDALLTFGLVGFQSGRDRYNFISCLRRFCSRCILKKNGSTLLIENGFGETVVGVFPIGIDYEDFVRTAGSSVVQTDVQTIRKHLSDSHVVVGVDRLDYTKGILERIKAFSVLLDRYPALRGRVVLIQIAVPSRESIRDYRDLQTELLRAVGEVNSRFGGPKWTPIRYLHRHFSRAELVAFYRAADVALITPLKDGMNLVSKEFCASRVQDTGVVILSEFAGAAHELKTGALLVNPYDVEGITNALYTAFEMNPREITRRMRRMRKRVRKHNVFEWCERILNAAGAVSTDSHTFCSGQITQATTPASDSSTNMHLT